ncbi:dihydrodipicolinate synthase family [Vibrio variabilis]|uniref:Dihydrodipicolinate synthase family n=1 Tax=Vibrio variabilis TaxID=990271 RepID=A0ABQ0JGI3_9VIBR|nr:dihydrodipicolinate synthase family [Vibrio variabilis]
MKKLAGIIVAMTTPFNDDDVIDFDALDSLTRYLVGTGVDCLFPGGTTSEMLRMSTQERKQIAETVVNAVEGRIPVFVQIAAATTETTIELAQHAMQSGADGIALLTPQFFATTEQEMATYFSEVANSLPNDFPIYLYSIPQYAANEITVDVVKQVIAVCPNVVGIKFSLADMNRTLDYINVSPDFSVVHGFDKMALGLLTAGCDGIVSGCACAIPEPLVQIYKAYQQGDLVRAERWQRIATDLSSDLLAGANLAYFKAAVDYVGQTGGNMRRPLLNISEDERLQLCSKLDVIKARIERALRHS